MKLPKKLLAVAGALGITASGMSAVAATDPAPDTVTVNPTGDHSATYLVANDKDTIDWMNKQPASASLPTAYKLPGSEGAWFCAVQNGHTSPAAIGGITYNEPTEVTTWAGSTFDQDTKTAKTAPTMKKGDENYGAIAYLNSVADLPTNMTSQGLQVIKIAEEVISNTLESGSMNDTYYQNNKALIDSVIAKAKEQRGPYTITAVGDKTPEVETWADGTTHLTLPGFQIKTATGAKLDTSGITRLIDKNFTGYGIHTVNGLVTIPAGVASFDNIPAQSGASPNTYAFSYKDAEDPIEITFNTLDCSNKNVARGISVSMTGLPADTISVATPKETPEKNPDLFTNTVSKSGAQTLFQMGLTMPGDMTVPVCQDNPTLKTTATFKDTKEKTATAGEKDLVITDVATYTNLVENSEYELKGTLMDKNTKKPVSTASTTFTAKKNGTVSLDLTLPKANQTQTAQYVVFETVTLDGKEIVTHEDYNDQGQTVTVTLPDAPTIDTVAVGVDGSKNMPINGGTIQDTITHQNLKPGTYTVSSTVVSLKTNKNLVENVESTVVVKDDSPFTVAINVPSIQEDLSLLNGTSFVVTEKVIDENGTVIAIHDDLTDADQTLTVVAPTPPIPAVKTTATWENGEKTMTGEGKPGVILDSVQYTNLTPGTEYTLVGVVHQVNQGKLEDSGAKVDASQYGMISQYFNKDVKSIVTVNVSTFTPTEENGTANMRFTVPADLMKGSKDFVVYEYVVLTGDDKATLVSSHENPEDADQTVTLRTPLAKTGSPIVAFITASVVALTVGVAALWKRRKL